MQTRCWGPYQSMCVVIRTCGEIWRIGSDRKMIWPYIAARDRRAMPALSLTLYVLCCLIIIFWIVTLFVFVCLFFSSPFYWLSLLHEFSLFVSFFFTVLHQKAASEIFICFLQRAFTFLQIYFYICSHLKFIHLFFHIFMISSSSLTNPRLFFILLLAMIPFFI